MNVSSLTVISLLFFWQQLFWIFEYYNFLKVNDNILLNIIAYNIYITSFLFSVIETTSILYVIIKKKCDQSISTNFAFGYSVFSYCTRGLILVNLIEFILFFYNDIKHNFVNFAISLIMLIHIFADTIDFLLYDLKKYATKKYLPLQQ